MDLSSLRERREYAPLTVTELNEQIKHILETEPKFAHLIVRGEISNFVRHTSGHLYFTLKDEGGQIKAVMFRQSALRLLFTPTDGMKVLVTASVSVYGKSGSYQLYVQSMQPDGVGALYMAYEQLKVKLQREGLFDLSHKVSIPTMPKNIGVITSATGAAIRDIIHITGRRFPLANLYIYPSLVQGDGAENNLIRALKYFERTKQCDVVIIGRGGGSIEDLWAFNSEKLARTIYDMTVPVISAVGHETDFTICDFAADLRAPTPSAAAELSTPDSKEFLLFLDAIPERISHILKKDVSNKERRLIQIRTSRVFRSMDGMYVPLEDRMHRAYEQLKATWEKRLDACQKKVALLAEKAQALSPLSVLARGYTLTVKNDTVISHVDDLQIGDPVTITMAGGQADAVVNAIRKESET